MQSKTEEYNSVILSSLSEFINNCPDAINSEMVKDTMRDCGFSAEQSYRVLLSGALGLYENREIMRLYMDNIVKKLEPKKYTDNPYYRNIKLGTSVFGKNWSVITQKYKPYELFVYNDLRRQPDGRILPSIGFFECEYAYPCILQNGREWMMITPNEIETMSAPLRRAHGKVLTYGLGLGYFAYMACAKPEVESVTVVEKDSEVISLFRQIILPQFPHAHGYTEKLNIINADALYYAAEQKLSSQNKYDFIFADIWHDPSDGKELYLLLKSLERSDAEYAYWIEDTIKCYL